jgi:hypothetical protein
VSFLRKRGEESFGTDALLLSEVNSQLSDLKQQKYDILGLL